jgi:thiol-disulfide isomerase/thioredoxin
MKTIATLAALAATMLAVLANDENANLPEITLDQVSWGTVVNNADFDAEALAGKVVVVEKWGVNCGPCIASLPEMAKLARRYETKGLAVVGLEVQGGDDETINELLKDARVKYPVTKGGTVKSNTNGIPNVSVFDIEGKLVWQGHPADGEFEKAVKAALKAYKK